MKSALLAVLIVVTTTLAPHGARAQVYKWVDESGKTHFGDAPPPAQRKGAKQVELKGVYVNQEQRQEAIDRAAGERARSAPAKTAAPAPAAPKPSFEQQMANYRDSQECFASYRNKNNSLRQEAYEKCGPELKQPSQDAPREVTPSR